MKKTKKKSASASTKKTGERKEVRKRYGVFHESLDGTLTDIVYLRDKNKAVFAVTKGNDIVFKPTIFIGKDSNHVATGVNAVYQLIPSRDVAMHAEKNFVLPPSGVVDFGTPMELYQEIRSFIRKYVILPDERFYDVATVYVMLTAVFDRFNTIPYLRVIGDLGTGKSRFLEVIGKLSYRSIMASGSISMSAIFRTLDVVRGTLVFDEADFRSSSMTDEIVKILNGGHKKDAPVVRMEVVNDRMKTMSFEVFGPKILGSRHDFTDTALESRCITQRLFPLKEVIGVPTHLPFLFNEEALSLRNKLLMFRFKYYRQLQDNESSLEGLGFPRLRQTALALTSVAKFIGEEARRPVIEFLMDYEKTLLSNVATNVYADVLLCIAWLIETDEEVRSSGKLYIGHIAHEFNRTFYEDYTSRETRKLDTKDGPLTIPGQKVSARKIGSYVERLGLAKDRDGYGFYIPIGRESSKIQALVGRYSLEDVLKHKMQEESKDKPTVPIRSPGSVTSSFIEDDPQPFPSR